MKLESTFRKSHIWEVFNNSFSVGDKCHVRPWGHVDKHAAVFPEMHQQLLWKTGVSQSHIAVPPFGSSRATCG